MRPFLPFATLLGAAFLLGCQDPGPAGPDTEILGPSFTHNKDKEHGGPKGDGNGDGEATFTATFVDGGGTTCIEVLADDCNVKSVVDIFLLGGGPNLQTESGPAGVPATLDLSFFEAAPSGREYTDDEGAACFGFGDGKFIAGFSIIVKKNDIVNVNANFAAFTAKGKNGIIDVKYGLFLVGVNNGSDWPPAGTNTITWERFEMIHQGGPGRNVGCFGTGSLISATEVTNTTP